MLGTTSPATKSPIVENLEEETETHAIGKYVTSATTKPAIDAIL
jgi:hypothetical protein